MFLAIHKAALFLVAGWSVGILMFSCVILVSFKTKTNSVMDFCSTISALLTVNEWDCSTFSHFIDWIIWWHGRCSICCLFSYHMQVSILFSPWAIFPWEKISGSTYDMHIHKGQKELIYFLFFLSFKCSLWSSAIILLVLAMIVVDLMVPLLAW